MQSGWAGESRSCRSSVTNYQLVAAGPGGGDNETVCRIVAGVIQIDRADANISIDQNFLQDINRQFLAPGLRVVNGLNQVNPPLMAPTWPPAPGRWPGLPTTTKLA
jgi:hypothetical protein